MEQQNDLFLRSLFKIHERTQNFKQNFMGVVPKSMFS